MKTRAQPLLGFVPLIVFALAPQFCPAEQPDYGGLFRQLRLNAPLILQELEKEKCRNVGVLKFLLRDEHKRRRRDDAGTLNLLMAQRLEAALRYAKKSTGNSRINFVHDASHIAATTPGASHLSKDGQRKLFNARYPLADENRTVQVDALITGEIVVRGDIQSMKVEVHVIKADSSLRRLNRFQCSTMGVFAELGASYHRRAGGLAEDDYRLAMLARDKPDQFHPQNGNPLVSFQVFYDNQPVETQMVDGEVWIPEPRQGQQVKLKLERLDPTGRMLGAVVRVNGENVIGRQRKPDFACRMYHLEKDAPAFEIKAFQEDPRGGGGFVVASREKSKELEVYYGPDVGTISLTVFEEFEDGQKTDLHDPVLRAIAAGEVPDEDEDVTVPDDNRVRGVITAGARVAQLMRIGARRNWNPYPIFSHVIRYYQPNRNPTKPKS